MKGTVETVKLTVIRGRIGSMSTLTITEFLEARIAEDEAEVQAALLLRGSGTHWRIGHPLDPARVLAECAAKRAILNLADEALRAQADRRDASALGAELMHDDVLGALAAVYADHPDYRQEWKL